MGTAARAARYRRLPQAPWPGHPNPALPVRAVALRSGGAGCSAPGAPTTAGRESPPDERRARTRIGGEVRRAAPPSTIGSPSASAGVPGWGRVGAEGEAGLRTPLGAPGAPPQLAELLRGSQPPGGARLGCGRLGTSLRRLGGGCGSGAFGHPWTRVRAGTWSFWGTRKAGLGDRR